MPDIQDIFFDRAEVTRDGNGVIVIVLQVHGTGGREPSPVAIVSCREAGALALMSATARALERK